MKELEKKLGYTFHNKELLRQALTPAATRAGLSAVGAATDCINPLPATPDARRSPLSGVLP